LNYTKMFRLRQGSAYRNSYALVAVLEQYIRSGSGELDTFAFTDQPMTCPKCGTRSQQLDASDERGTEHVEWCPTCGYVFKVEE